MMKSNLFLLLLLSVLSFTSCQSQNATTEKQKNAGHNSAAALEKTPVLIELFTSEG